MSAALKESMLKLRAKLDGLQPRERNIVLILALVVMVFMWDLLVFSSLQSDVKSARDQSATVAQQMTTINSQLVELSKPGNANPNAALQVQKQQLNIAIDQISSNIKTMTGNLIPAKRMVQVLEDVLHESSDLQLLRVKSLPVRKLISDSAGNVEDVEPNQQEGVLYLHAVELELRGDYFETLRYLQALEELPWQVIWDQLEYQVEGYPKANIRLRINTLSSGDGLLGV
ncbi:MAG: type II secretion system protein GspM [Pseudomonadales bacterium]